MKTVIIGGIAGGLSAASQIMREIATRRWSSWKNQGSFLRRLRHALQPVL